MYSSNLTEFCVICNRGKDYIYVACNRYPCIFHKYIDLCAINKNAFILQWARVRFVLEKFKNRVNEK